MGQYFIIANVTKRQYLHPHRFDDGLKLMEFGASGGGVMMALAVLLADSNSPGNFGDLKSASPVVGSWAGDQIVITGDYGEDGNLYGSAPADDPPRDDEGRVLCLYKYAQAEFEDVSLAVHEALTEAGENVGSG